MNRSLKAIIPVFLFAFLCLFALPPAALAGAGITGTWVLAPGQYPAGIKKMNPASVFVVYDGPLIRNDWQKKFFSRDTITKLKGLQDSAGNCIRVWRLVFGKGREVDSVWQLNENFLLTDKAYNRGAGLLECIAYDLKGGITDQFVFDYARKYEEEASPQPSLIQLLRKVNVYSSGDRNRFSVGAVWALSIGINRYKGDLFAELKNCESDARSYAAFFREQYRKHLGGRSSAAFFHEYTLLGESATRAAILSALREIASKASPADYFVFNFSGYSLPLLVDSPATATYFFPFDSAGYARDFLKEDGNETATQRERLLSLKVLQEYIQLIPAQNQLFITEAGPTDKFKTEFIRTLMQQSPLVSGLLNKNRVIIVPNGYGADDLRCAGVQTGKGPINYYLTGLDSNLNVFHLLEPGFRSEAVLFNLKNAEARCSPMDKPYFDIFFERNFLKQYQEIFGDGEPVTRGLIVKEKDIRQELGNLEGKKYALVIGTDQYRGKGWDPLRNPVRDARAVAAELKEGYGFEVQLLENKPMDSIYAALRYYHRVAGPNDQFVFFVAGHGDMDDELLDDGFLVCTDSRSVEDDPVRNTYISYQKLQKIINNIPARQILVLLDVCHGGVFDQQVFNAVKREGTVAGITNRNILQFLKDKWPLRTRKFLSSVGTAPAFDGQAGKHSPFANLLLQVLQSRGASTNGIITLSDLFKVLQTASLNETATLRIMPAMNDFGSFEPFSEFIFIPVSR